MHAVNGVCKRTLVRIIFRHHSHRAPLSSWPIVPVLHYHINGDMPLAECLQRFQQVIAANITLLRLRVAKEIARHHGCLARKPSVTLNGLVLSCALHEVIVYL